MGSMGKKGLKNGGGGGCTLPPLPDCHSVKDTLPVDYTVQQQELPAKSVVENTDRVTEVVVSKVDTRNSLEENKGQEAEETDGFEELVRQRSR